MRSIEINGINQDLSTILHDRSKMNMNPSNQINLPTEGENAEKEQTTNNMTLNGIGSPIYRKQRQDFQLSSMSPNSGQQN